MKITKLIVVLWVGMASSAVAQSSFQIPNPVLPLEKGKSASQSASLTASAAFVNKQTQATTDYSLFQPGIPQGFLPFEGQEYRTESDHFSFNATQPKSRALLNPDQFWTRKSRPVIDARNQYLLGDHTTACDEWAGYCGCCGLKMNPGHLGQRWLSTGDPCECVDNCCPERRCRRCRAIECK